MSGPGPSPNRIGTGLALRRQHASLLPEFRRALDEIVASAAFVMGPPVAQLEAALADLVGAEAVALNSGTDALVIALRALDVGPGDEVIVPAFSFFATAEAVLLAGATPVLVDIEPRTMTIDAARAAARVGPRTRAIIPVHLYGQCADVEGFAAATRRAGFDVAVVEDMAQALGATRGGRAAGSLGALAALSFYPTKNLGALGDGGMLFATRPDLAARARRLRDHGSSRKYHHDEAGYNSRLDTLQAAFLLAKLPRLGEWTERRCEIAARYTRELADLPLELPVTGAANAHVWHLYTVRTPARDALRAHLDGLGIECAIHYPVGLHRSPALAPFAADGGAFPETDRAAAQVLSLPVFPEMTDEEVARVVEAARAFPGFQR